MRLCRLRFANGDGSLPAVINAHRFFAAATIALRPAALRLRFGLAGGVTAAVEACAGLR
jgi:hypothetical protein